MLADIQNANGDNITIGVSNICTIKEKEGSTNILIRMNNGDEHEITVDMWNYMHCEIGERGLSRKKFNQAKFDKEYKS